MDLSSWTSGEDVIRIVGSSSANSVVGSRAGDTLTAGSGADSLDGRDDIDTAVYTGNLAEYRINGTPAALTMTDLRSTGVSDGADTVSNIELFQFADGTFTLAQILDQFDVTTPVDADGAANAVAENAAIGTVVGLTASAADADAADTVSYALTGNPGGLFSIDAATGVVTVAGAIDRDAAGPSATIEVTATSSDGSTAASTFSVAIGAMSTSSMCRSLWTRTPAPIRWPRTR